MKQSNYIINIAFYFLLECRRDITSKVLFGQNLNPLDDSLGVEAVDYSADFDSMLKRLDKLKIYRKKKRWILNYYVIFQVCPKYFTRAYW